MNHVFTNNLFYKSAALAGKELKHRPGFWMLLHAKISLAAIGIFFLLAAGYAGGVAGLVTMLSIKWESMSFLANFMAQLDLKGIRFVAFFGGLLVATILFVVAMLYLLLNISLVFFANALDAARGKVCRGLVKTPRVFRFLPLLLLAFALSMPWDTPYFASIPGLKVVLFFMKYYLFYSRLYVAYLFMLDGSPFVQAVKQAWRATSSRHLKMFYFGAFYYVLVESVNYVGEYYAISKLLGTKGAIFVVVLSTILSVIIHVFYNLLYVNAYVLLQQSPEKN